MNTERGRDPLADIFTRHAHWPAFVAIIVLCGLAVGLPRINTLPLDGHEVLVAQTVREMHARGDWLVPYFNGAPRLQKPPMSYWLTGLTAALCGGLDQIEPWHARLPSLLAGLGLILLALPLARALYGDGAAVMTGLLLVTSAAFFSYTHDARPDMVYAFWCSAALVCLARLGARPSRGLALAMWACCALAILTKGPHIPAFVLLAGVMHWKIQHWSWRRVATTLHPLGGSLLLFALAAPWWLLLVERLGSDALFGSQIGGGLLRPDLHHLLDPYYFYRTFELVLPWLLLCPFALVTLASRDRRGRSRVLWLPVLVSAVGLTVGGQHRPLYMLPLLLPLTVLIAGGVMQAFALAVRGRARTVCFAVTASQIAVCIAVDIWFVARAVTLPPGWRLAVGAAAALVAAWAIRAFRQGDARAVLRALVVCALAFVLTWSSVAQTRLLWSDDRYNKVALAAKIDEAIDPRTPLVVFKVTPVIYVFYTQRMIARVDSAAALAMHLEQSATAQLGVLTRVPELAALSAEFEVEELGRINAGRDATVLVRITRP